MNFQKIINVLLNFKKRLHTFAPPTNLGIPDLYKERKSKKLSRKSHQSANRFSAKYSDAIQR